MNFVNFENLEGDVPPSRSVPSGIERGVGSLLQDDQALASAKCRTAGYGLFHETERIGIEAAMSAITGCSLSGRFAGRSRGDSPSPEIRAAPEFRPLSAS